MMKEAPLREPPTDKRAGPDATPTGEHGKEVTGGEKPPWERKEPPKKEAPVMKEPPGEGPAAKEGAPPERFEELFDL